MNIIQEILSTTSLKQKDIAAELRVSSAQVSKWKSGDPIPFDRLEKLCALAGLFGDDPDWAQFAKTENNARLWIAYIKEVNERSENGPSWQFEEDTECYAPILLTTLYDLGVNFPDQAPQFDDETFELVDESSDQCASHLHDLISSIMDNFTPLSDWVIRNLDIADDELEDEIPDIESQIIYIAMAWVEDKIIEAAGASIENWTSRCKQSIEDIKNTLAVVCRKKTSQLNVDYFALVRDHPYKIDDENTFSRLSVDDISNYYPLPQRETLKNTELNNELLLELHLKIDCLLTKEDRDKLSNILTLCPPNNNTLFQYG